jgi:hypothetical protein
VVAERSPGVRAGALAGGRGRRASSAPIVGPDTGRYASAGWKSFDGVAGRVLVQDLMPARPADDVVAERQASRPQALDLGRESSEGDMPTGTTQAHRPGRLVGVASAGRGRTPERSLVVLRWMAPGSGPLIAVRRLLDRSRPPEPEFERWMRRRKVNGRIRRGDRRRTACPPRPPGSRTAFGVPSRSPSTRRRLRPRSERTRRLRLVDGPRRDRRHPSRPPPHGRWGCSVSASPRRTGSSARPAPASVRPAHRRQHRLVHVPLRAGVAALGAGGLAAAALTIGPAAARRRGQPVPVGLAASAPEGRVGRGPRANGGSRRRRSA